MVQVDMRGSQHLGMRMVLYFEQLLGNIGWHSFRHSYATLLHALGASAAVQKALICHMDIQTTMNVYTAAVTTAKRAAQAKVVDALWRG